LSVGPVLGGTFLSRYCSFTTKPRDLFQAPEHL